MAAVTQVRILVPAFFFTLIPFIFISLSCKKIVNLGIFSSSKYEFLETSQKDIILLKTILRTQRPAYKIQIPLFEVREIIFFLQLAVIRMVSRDGLVVRTLRCRGRSNPGWGILVPACLF